MRLIGAVKRLEAGAAAARAAVPTRVAIAWTPAEVRIDAMELAAGEFIAVDLTQRRRSDGSIDAGASFWSVRERVTLDVNDLGFYYVADCDGGNAECGGVVVAIDTDMVRYELDAAPGAERQFLRPASRG
jgi:hypothetical protein